MFDILFNTISYLIIIAIGYLLRKTGVLKNSACDAVMALIMNLTLPCLLIRSSAGATLSGTMVIYLMLGFAVNALELAVCYIIGRKNKEPLILGVSMLASAGIDVGDFVLPFIQTFFPGLGVMILCIFNIGNTVMASGVNYAIAAKATAGSDRFGMKDILKRLFSSVVFDAYILIIFMAVTGLPWPERFMQVTGMIADANIFLVMIMIGLKLELAPEKEGDGSAAQILFSRFFCGIVMAVLTWLLPLPRLAKIVITAAYFGPPSALTNVFARKLGYEGGLASQVSVICIFTAMAIITGLMMIFV